MKPQRFLAVILCVFICGNALAQDIDTELSNLASNLAGQIKDQNKTKVTVLDFTDLQGGSSELGKYIAEQLTVDLVIDKKGFAVLDRANLKSILAEHKLTATGLIDPDTAKKLGLFAGVDAIILGTITPKDGNIALTAKIITTDTAEIIGAAKASFREDNTVQQLLSQTATAEDAASVVQAPSEPTVTKPFGDLKAKVESLQLIPGDKIYGYARLTLIITNTSESQTYGVALNPDFYNKFSVVNSRGDDFRATDVSGINTAYESFNGISGSVTDIPPKSSISIVSKSQVHWTGEPGDYRPYHLQTEVIFGIKTEGRHPDLEKYNLVIDIK